MRCAEECVCICSKLQTTSQVTTNTTSHLTRDTCDFRVGGVPGVQASKTTTQVCQAVCGSLWDLLKAFGVGVSTCAFPGGGALAFRQ